MKNVAWIILVALLAGITAVSVAKYIAAQKESYSLTFDLDQLQAQVGRLETQKQNLLQTIEKQKLEQAAISSSLSAANDRITNMETDFAQGQKQLADLSAQLNLIKEENVNLQNQGDTLKSELAAATQEKNALQAKLGSLAELKKAIRELKAKPRTVSKPQMQEKALAQAEIDGNRGFIIKDGKPTHPARVKIEVNPAPAR
jgi:chromosome segregation ATPase